MMTNRARKLRILFINRSYWPDSDVSCRSLTLLCEGLAKEFEVEVISGRRIQTQERHTASTVGSVRRHGVGIHRVFHTQFPKSSWLGSLLNLPTFLIAAFLTILWRSPPPDVVITGADPSLAPILGRFLKWRYRALFVAYLQNVDPVITPKQVSPSRLLHWHWLHKLLVTSCNQADQIIVLNEEARSRCIESGIWESIMTVIPHGVDCERIDSIKKSQRFRKENGLEDKFVVMAAASFGQTPLLDLIIDAATELKSNPEIVFILHEEELQKKDLQKKIEKYDLDNIRLLSYPSREPEQNLGIADAHIVSMHPEAKKRLWPNNLYDLLAAGTAIISLSPTDSALSRLVNSEEIGAVCDPVPASTCTSRFVETIRLMASDPEPVVQQGLRARQLCHSEFHLHSQQDRWTRLVRELTLHETGPGKINKQASHAYAGREDSAPYQC